MTTRKRTFTIWHGLAVSLALHGVIALPVVASVVVTMEDDDPPIEIELQGLTQDSQDLAETKQSEIEQKRGDVKDAKPAPRPTEDMQPQETAPSEEDMDVAAADDAMFNPPQPTPTPEMKKVEAPPPAPAMTAAPDENNVTGAAEEVPDTAKITPAEITDQQYSNMLMKKIRENIVYPDEARRARLQGMPLVTFVIRADGGIRPETLKIAKSSGHPALDAAALNTVRASAPFFPPPREMAVSVGVFLGEIGAARK